MPTIYSEGYSAIWEMWANIAYRTRFISQLGWLPGQDSNLGLGIQSPLCYHYTTGQRV